MDFRKHLTPDDLIVEIELILDETKAAILANVDSDGSPHMRWMTPSFLKDRRGALFAVTSPHFGKVDQLKSNEKVQWIFQNRSLTKMVTINGRVNILENSNIRSEVLEVIGSRLTVFWRYNTNESDLVVLETVIKDGNYFVPMKGHRETINFKNYKK